MKQTVLITGGTGFLGKRLALALKDSCHVVLGARDNKRNLQAGEFTGCPAIPLDVAHVESVRDAIVATRPDIVIHAAATKFVDLAEREPMECIDVNVTGSQNVLRVAIDKGVGTLIGISTDKASPPVRNTYGLSKALMERAFCSMNGRTATRCLCVRYGNVAWSTGSVLPIWRRMQQQTGVIHSTGPDMRRFFFTVDEAAQLVLTAMDHAEDLGGKVLSRRMKAAQIADVLRVWVAHRGGAWERAAGRPGEREDEFLVGDLEVPYTETVSFNDVPHYVIDFNRMAAAPMLCGVSSANTDRLTDDELAAIVTSPPPEEADDV